MSRTTIRTQRLRRLVLLQVVVVLGLVPGVLGPVTALGAHAPRGQDRAGAFNSAITILAGGRTVEYARSRPHPAYAYDVVATPMTASTTLLVDAPHVDGSFDDFSERSPHTIKQILGDEEAAALDLGENAATDAAEEAEPGPSWTWKTREKPGADDGISEYGKERVGEETISTAHRVNVEGDVVHQHQTYIGKYGGERQFPNEWVQYPDVGSP